MERCLDLGCGQGGFYEIALPDRTRLESWLAKHGNRYSVGLDADRQALRVARLLITNGTRFIQGDALAIPYRQGHFDKVHIFGLLHHAPNWRGIIGEMARVHKPGGTLELTETVDNWPPYRLARHVLGAWQGYKIHSFFETGPLLEELARYYEFTRVSYHWRPILAEILRLYNLEPLISLQFLAALDKFLALAGQSEKTACHVVVIAKRR